MQTRYALNLFAHYKILTTNISNVFSYIYKNTIEKHITYCKISHDDLFMKS